MVEPSRLIEHSKKINLNFLTTALNTLSEGMLIIDLDFKILYKNPAADFLLHGLGDKIDLHSWKSNFKILDAKTTQELCISDMPISRAVGGLKFTDYHVFIMGNHEDEGRYLSFNGIPLFNDEHNIIGGVLTFRDITSKVKAQKILEQEKAFFKNILDLIPAAVFVYGNLDEFYFKNERFEQLQRDVRNAGWIPSEKAKEIIQDHDQQVRKSLEVMEFDEFIDFPQGRRYLRTIRFPIYHQTNEKLLICAIAFDVTDRVLMENKLENERLTSINASKLAAIGALASEIGHEINNPISIIRSVTFLIREMMNDKVLTDDILSDKIATIDTTVNRVGRIINSLRNLSRKSSNETKDKCVLGQILTDVISLCDLKLTQSNVKIIIDRESPVFAYSLICYEIQFSQVLMNLISNAIDAVIGQEKPMIRISFDEDSDHIYIRVLDSGEGVPEALREKIFEPFFTTKVLGKGTGLGLSISKNIMLAHDGDLFLAPKSEGSCFIVKLPKTIG